MPCDKNLASKDEVHLGLRAKIFRLATELLSEKSIESLKVSDICKKAEISRPTFYRLFESKYDIYNWYLRITMRSNLAQIGICFSWDTAFPRFFRAIDANREASRAFFASDAQESPLNQFPKYIENSLTLNVKKRFPDKLEIPYRYAFQVKAFSRSFPGAVLDWLEGDDPPYGIIDNVVAIVPKDLFELLNVDTDGKPFSLGDLRYSDKSPLIEFVAETNPMEF